MNPERYVVAKFGGSSMVDADSISGVADIIRSDPNRRIVVVSAPGRNHSYPDKITDLLIAARSDSRYDRRQACQQISERFSLIGEQLGIRQIKDWLDQVQEEVDKSRYQWPLENGLAWCKSRGEWLMARVFAQYLGATFVDATEIIRIIKVANGSQIDPASYELVENRLVAGSELFVIPGFYGLDRSGQLQTFDRGGSDITGAIVARGVKARVYENWTDVNGVLSANPKIVGSPSTIAHITYAEMRELGNRGATVLQRDTILPLVEVGIPINIRNTFNPLHPGTMIEVQRPRIAGEHAIGIADDGPFVSFDIHRYGMNEEVGTGRKILEIFSDLGIPYEHFPSSRDYVSVIIDQNRIDDERTIRGYLQNAIHPDRIYVQKNLGLLSLVGQGICDHAAEVSGKLFSKLDKADILVKGFSFSTSGISIVVVVDNDRLKGAVRLAHNLFIEQSSHLKKE